MVFYLLQNKHVLNYFTAMALSVLLSGPPTNKITHGQMKMHKPMSCNEAHRIDWVYEIEEFVFQFGCDIMKNVRSHHACSDANAFKTFLQTKNHHISNLEFIFTRIKLFIVCEVLLFNAIYILLVYPGIIVWMGDMLLEFTNRCVVGKWRLVDILMIIHTALRGLQIIKTLHDWSIVRLFCKTLRIELNGIGIE